MSANVLIMGLCCERVDYSPWTYEESVGAQEKKRREIFHWNHLQGCNSAATSSSEGANYKKKKKLQAGTSDPWKSGGRGLTLGGGWSRCFISAWIRVSGEWEHFPGKQTNSAGWEEGKKNNAADFITPIFYEATTRDRCVDDFKEIIKSLIALWIVDSG